MAQRDGESDPENLILFRRKAAVFFFFKCGGVGRNITYFSLVERSGISMLQTEDILDLIVGLELFPGCLSVLSRH